MLPIDFPIANAQMLVTFTHVVAEMQLKNLVRQLCKEAFGLGLEVCVTGVEDYSDVA